MQMAGSANRQFRLSEFPCPAVILSVEGEGESRVLNRSALDGAGYDVISVGNVEEALRQIARVRVDVLVLGNHLSRAERLRIEEGVARLRPKPRVILLYTASVTEAEQADAVLNTQGDPQDLVRTIQYLLTGKC
jgi:DNA-binding NtrC family response regulator